MTRWKLYVDETGDFANRDGAVAVVGVLTREDALPPPALLRARLLAAVPWAPWPLHAAHLLHPMFYVLAREVAEASSAPAYTDVAGALRDVGVGDEPLLARCRALVSAGKLPRIDELNTLAAHLDRDRRTRLRDRLGDDYWRLIRVLRQLCDAAAPDSLAISLVAAVEGSRGAAMPASVDSPDPASVRYLSMLGALEERVLDILGSLPGEAHLVELHVMTRSVHDSALGTRTALHPRHLSIRSRSRSGSGPQGDRIVPWKVEEFGTHMEPALALPDLVALRLRWVLGPALDRPDLGLATIESRIQRHVALPIRSAASHLIAAGAGDGAGTSRWGDEIEREWVAARERRMRTERTRS